MFSPILSSTKAKKFVLGGEVYPLFLNFIAKKHISDNLTSNFSKPLNTIILKIA